jgi:hypothetical protein
MMFAVLGLLAACNKVKPTDKEAAAAVGPPAINCAYPPQSFIRNRDTDVSKAIARGVIVEDFVSNKVTIFWEDSDQVQANKLHPQIAWNGSPIDRRTLDSYLIAVTKMKPIPVTEISFSHGAPCEEIRAVRKMMENRLDCERSHKCVQG